MNGLIRWLSITIAATWLSLAYADVDLPTKFTNKGGVANTRHNLTQQPIGAGFVNMNPYRNNYEQVCVYCHTPHGSNKQINAPLWNRTINTGTYTTYDTLGTASLTAAVTQPGGSSLSCLSCHDGTIGIDSIINIPGSGKYEAAQETSQNNGFLNAQWDNSTGADASVHIGLVDGNKAAQDTGCLACHSDEGGLVGSGATNFKAFALSTDLTDDHPVGVALPTARIGVDFFDPATTGPNGVRYYDDGDSRMESNEIRFYDTGDGPEVECASCHDPHGVSPTGFGGTINATFLRKSNAGSAVCLTCHDF